MLFRSVVSGLAATVFSATFANAFSNPGACSGNCWSHDPNVIRRESDGVYFRFDTGSEISTMKADSLTGPWTAQGSALPGGSTIDLAGNTDLWAPEVHYIDGTYYLYYAVSAFGSQASEIGYATSATMEVGSWTDHGSTGVKSVKGSPYNAIDPNLVAVGSSYVMNFGSFWGDIYQVAMDSPTKASSGATYQVQFNSSGSHAAEGSFMYYRSGYYYLLWSAGTCCGFDTSKPAAGNEYAIKVCRSTKATGGFVDQTGKSCTAGGGTTLLSSHGYVYGPGGQGIFADPTHGTVLYYHYANTNIGLADSQFQFGWNTLTWSGGWPSV
ncbi:glycoside hydrolase, family 43 [Grosmannia clavigera kw1407]|uniref:Arabinan endo-1,5-alpha-L-arabinosidase n=1 Tax=Grosmannia clavigera (strain kw1407 / UAMH 11150) TaxID=655863 RepID=F0XL68_GROCL|nr:glycoside hydrolase, family 43 [Grosmannia clavigera kw1407]EFX01844.1 glycoside hydrolase, family 43 [Grosmannia clavigera kw1407]